MIAKEEENKPIMLTTERRTAIFETMPVKKAVLTQIAPAIASQMIALVYNLADTYFVGLLNDPHQTAAITVVYPSFVMLTAISNLFGVGGASALARAMGTKETEKARHISVISLWGGVLSALLFSLLFWLAKSPLLTICGAREVVRNGCILTSRFPYLPCHKRSLPNVGRPCLLYTSPQQTFSRKDYTNGYHRRTGERYAGL